MESERIYEIEMIVKKGSAKPGDKIKVNENDALKLIKGGYAKAGNERDRKDLESKLPKAKAAPKPAENTLGNRTKSDDTDKGGKSGDSKSGSKA